MSERLILAVDGTERAIDDLVIDKFAATLRGRLLRPSDGAYDAARKVWNGMVDRRPALIACCAGAADVVECVRFARKHESRVTVRGGGHNAAGRSVSHGGLMIDLSPMKDLRVDAVRQTARAEAGLRLGEFDRGTQPFGLATTLGVNTDTGIAGLTLGGGYGWLNGKFGLACDNVRSVDIVTADGQLRTASAHENADLFWGVRGAGANLGIVTSFEYVLHPVGPVLGGLVLYPIDSGKDVLRRYDEFAAGCPDEVSTVAALLTAPNGEPAVGIAACYCGPIDRGDTVLAPIRRLTTPLADSFEPQPYVKMQTLFDATWPPGRLYYIKSSIVRRLGDGAIDVLLAYARTQPTPSSAIALQQLHGAASRVSVDGTAFPHRYDHLSLYVHPATDDPAKADTIVRWGRECWNALQPFVERAVYVNALDEPGHEDEARLREAYGPNYERVVALKRRFDPTNFFSGNPNLSVSAAA